ncbi:MAG: hypothetical protein ACOYYU_05300 [Chloroflexota bacterium]
MADGLLTALGERTFLVVREHVEQAVRVSEAGMAAAMRFVWEHPTHPLPASPKCQRAWNLGEEHPLPTSPKCRKARNLGEEFALVLR